MKKQISAIDFSGIEKAIITVKGQNVIIDSDVASIYGVLTKEVNQAIKNNPDKFPNGTKHKKAVNNKHLVSANSTKLSYGSW